MFLALLLFCTITFDESPVLLRQIELDQNGFSCNTIDGVAGQKSDRAEQAARGKQLKTHNPFRVETVTQAKQKTPFGGTDGRISHGGIGAGLCPMG